MKKSLAIVAFAAVITAVVYSSTPLPDKLLLGYSQEAPYAFVNPKGELQGVFVEAAHRLTETLDITGAQWLLQDFYQLFPSLSDKRIDVIAAGITITAERAARYCFAEPLLVADSGILVLSGSEYTGQNPAQINGKIAVLANSVEHRQLVNNKQPALPVATIREAALAVLEGEAEALAGTLPAIMQVMQEFAGAFTLIDAAPPLNMHHYSAFAFHRDNQAWVNEWNKAQRELHKDPAFLERVSQFGFYLPQLPESISARCYEP